MKFKRESNPAGLYHEKRKKIHAPKLHYFVVTHTTTKIPRISCPAKVTFHFRYPPPPPRRNPTKPRHSRKIVDRWASKDNCTATSADRCRLAGVVVLWRVPDRPWGQEQIFLLRFLVYELSLTRFLHQRRDSHGNPDPRPCLLGQLACRLVFVSLFNCLVSLPNWTEHGFNAS